MRLIKNLGEKPWLPQPASEAALIATNTAGGIALRFFIAVISVFFFLFTLTFISRSQYGDFQALAGESWLPLNQPWQLWINTGWLVLASIFLQLCCWQQGSEKAWRLTLLLTLVVICSLLFVQGQWQVWQQLSALGYSVNSNPANSYFYLLTGIHAVHLVGGLLALLRVLVVYSSSRQVERLFQSLQLCRRYWHYLLLLWLFLFALLTAPASAYDTIAAWCGL
jgi:cytochrome c oxidase subunit 3